MTDFRALCAELVEKLDELNCHYNVPSQSAMIDRARAALAEPESIEDRIAQADAEIEASMGRIRKIAAMPAAQLAAERRALDESDGPAVPDGREPASVTGQPSDEELLETLDKATATFPPRHPEAEGLNAVEYPLALELRKARAVLARWGNPAPQPVPVSERLPGPEDCDAEGRCWLRGKVEGDWRLLDPNNSGVPQLKYCFTHWLPAHALPVPGQEVR